MNKHLFHAKEITWCFVQRNGQALAGRTAASVPHYLCGQECAWSSAGIVMRLLSGEGPARLIIPSEKN